MKPSREAFVAKTLVVFGSSSDRDYSFLAPITALFWREVVGFEPLVFLVGTEAEWRAKPDACVVLDGLRLHDVGVCFTGNEMGDFPIGTIAQHVRYHAAADSAIAEDRWVMMTDADLWPLRGYFYQAHTKPDAMGKLAVCYYSNGDHFKSKEDVLEGFRDCRPFQSIPTCHVTMRACEWRTVYDLIPDDVLGSTRVTLKDVAEWVKRYPDPNFALWCSDQWLVAEHLCRQAWFPDAALMIPRYGHPPTDRLDRSAPNDWRVPFEMKYTDAHLLKKPHEEGAWGCLLPIIDTLLPDQAAWAREYREAFVR